MPNPTIETMIEYSAAHHGLTQVVIEVADLESVDVRFKATAKFAFRTSRAATGPDPYAAMAALAAVVQADVTRWNQICTCPEHCPKNLNPEIG